MSTLPEYTQIPTASKPTSCVFGGYDCLNSSLNYICFLSFHNSSTIIFYHMFPISGAYHVFFAHIFTYFSAQSLLCFVHTIIPFTRIYTVTSSGLFLLLLFHPLYQFSALELPFKIISDLISLPYIHKALDTFPFP